MISIAISHTMGNLPPNPCFTSEQDRANAYDAAQQFSLPINFTTVIVSMTAPGPDDRDKVWVSVDGSGRILGTFLFSNGAWQTINPVAPYIVPGEFREYDPAWYTPVAPWFACVTGNTLVTMPDYSQRTIKDLVDSKYNGEVLSYDVETEKIITSKVIDWYENKAEKSDWMMVQGQKVDNKPRTIFATKNHPFWTERGWVEADKLSSTDKVHKLRYKLPKEYHAVPFALEGIPFTENGIEPDECSSRELISLSKDSYHEKAAFQKRYDLKIEGTRCFFANNYLTHNCDGSVTGVADRRGTFTVCAGQRQLTAAQTTAGDTATIFTQAVAGGRETLILIAANICAHYHTFMGALFGATAAGPGVYGDTSTTGPSAAVPYTGLVGPGNTTGVMADGSTPNPPTPANVLPPYFPVHYMQWRPDLV